MMMMMDIMMMTMMVKSMTVTMVMAADTAMEDMEDMDAEKDMVMEATIIEEDMIMGNMEDMEDTGVMEVIKAMKAMMVENKEHSNLKTAIL